jgi:hypothetical protein
MPEPGVYVFLKVANWEFFAVEAGNSDEALNACLSRKNWSLDDLVYLGRIDGPLPPRRMDPRWVPGPENTPPPEIHEPALAYS